MKVIAPDFHRSGHRAGAGAVPPPVDIDGGVTGFSDLGSFRIRELSGGTATEDETEGDELLIVLLAGAVAIDAIGGTEVEFRLGPDGDWALYLPPRHRFRIEPLTPCAVAYVRAPSRAEAGPRAFRPRQGILAIDEPAERLRLRLLPLEGETDASAGLGERLERLAHITGPATILGRRPEELPPAHTLALFPGEGARIAGEGELLTVAALPLRRAAGT